MKFSHFPNYSGTSPFSSVFKKMFKSNLIIFHISFYTLLFYLTIYYEHFLMLLSVPHRDHLKCLHFIKELVSYVANPCRKALQHYNKQDFRKKTCMNFFHIFADQFGTDYQMCSYQVEGYKFLTRTLKYSSSRYPPSPSGQVVQLPCCIAVAVSSPLPSSSSPF